jgi:competence protein ComFC
LPGASLPYSLYRSIWLGLDLIFPPICGGCKKPGSRWCSDCQQKVLLINSPVCEICGVPENVSRICTVCQKEKPRYSMLRSWAVFVSPVQDALHRLKYRRDIGLGDALAAQMVEFVHRLDWPIDMIIPIPLGRKRLNERGYNQVGLVARPLAMALGLEYASRELRRRRETRSQVGLSKTARLENVRDAFVAGQQVRGKTVLVVDDVATTGSTLSSAADAFFESGAKDVYGLTVARALPRHGLDRV